MILVSYFHQTGNGFGFGETLSSRRFPLGVEDVNTIRADIQKHSPELEKVAIVAIISLRRWWQFWK